MNKMRKQKKKKKEFCAVQAAARKSSEMLCKAAFSTWFQIIRGENCFVCDENHLFIEFSASFKTVTSDRSLKTTQKQIPSNTYCSAQSAGKCMRVHMDSSSWLCRV